MTIHVYSQPNCPPCEFIKTWLKEHQIPFEEFNIKADRKALHRMMKQYDSFSTPTIVLNDKAFTMHQWDELEPLLKEQVR